MAKTPRNIIWHEQIGWLIIIIIVSLGLSYLLLSWAFDTGNWWEYFGALIFLILAINRLIFSFKLRSKRE